MYDPDGSDQELPWIVGRKRYGRITIANSDAAASLQRAAEKCIRSLRERSESGPSLASQRDDRIHSRGAPGGKSAREDRDPENGDRRHDVGCRVERLHLEQQAS